MMLRHSMIRMLGLAPLLATVGLVACMSAGPPPTTVSEMTVAIATVEAVDQTARDVLLRRPNGELLTVQAGPAVRNLAQMRAGDQVRVVYEQAVALRLSPPGSSFPAAVNSSGQRAPHGARPAGAASESARLRVRITAVDRGSKTVSFTGPRGDVHTLVLRDPDVIAFVRELQPGDEVDVEYTQALAISVEPATTRGSL